MIYKIARICTLSLLVLFAGAASRAQTYTQTTHGCTTIQCADAQFSPNICNVSVCSIPTLSYGFHFETCGQQDVSGFATWNGVEYTDAAASMKFLGYKYNGKNYYPDGVWEVTATFNSGASTITEHFRAYRNCSSIQNLDGQVVIQ